MDSHNALKLLTISDIVRITGMSRQKTRRLIEIGFLPRASIPGRTIYVFECDLMRIFRPQATSTTTTA